MKAAPCSCTVGCLSLLPMDKLAYWESDHGNVHLPSLILALSMGKRLRQLTVLLDAPGVAYYPMLY